MIQGISKRLMAWLSQYSMQNEEVVGVDISANAVRVVQLDNAGKEWTLTKLGYKNVPNTTLNGPDDSNRGQYVDRLRAAIASAKITTTNAALSIPVNNAIVQVVTLPLMTDEELKGAIATDSLWENVVQSTDDLDEYSIFWQVINRDETANSMELLFVASKIADVQFYADIARDAGLNPVILDVRCFALKSAIDLHFKRREPGKTIAVVEVGGHENYVMILRDNAPYISGLFVADGDKAGLLDSNLTRDRVQAITDRLAMQVRQSISSYESRVAGLAVDEVILVSAETNFDLVSECLSQSLSGLKTSVFKPTQKVQVPQQLKEPLAAESNPSVFTASVGLASRKLDIFGYYQYVTGAGSETVNLLPDRDQIKSSKKNRLLIKFVGFLAALGLIAGLGYITYSQFKAGEQYESAALEYDQLELQKNQLLADISKTKREKKAYGGMFEASKSLRSNQKFMYDLLVDITRKIPEGVWLDSIEYQGSTSLNIAGKSISDQNILQLIAELNRSQLITRASLSTMTIAKQNGREIKKFNLIAQLSEFNAAVPDAEEAE